MKKSDTIRRILATLMSLAIMMTMVPGNLLHTAQAANATIMEIRTADELKAFRDAVNNGNDFEDYQVKLTADIVLPEKEEWKPIGYTETGTHFKGEFDGQGYTIRNLYIHSRYEYNGLFGFLEGFVENVGLIDTDISVKADCVGSICAYIERSNILNCYNIGNVTGQFSTGGICGVNEMASIMNCYNTGNVTGTTNVGGICGYNSGVLQNSYNIGDVTSSKNYSGGICGVNSLIVQNCYNAGMVTGPDKVGGVCGYNRYWEFTNCYYLNTSATNAIGVITGGNGNMGSDLCSFDVDNKFPAKVNVYGEEYESLIDALNGWVKMQKPYHSKWLFDTDLVRYPVFSYALAEFEMEFSDSVSEYIYTGEAIEPSVTVSLGTKTLTNGVDYVISYAENVQAGTATVTARGIGNYAGTLEKNFIIQAKPIDGMKASLKAKSYTYDGKAKEPVVILEDGTKTLVNGTDYTVIYSANTDIGTALVTITGLGNYTGTLEANFSITEVVLKPISSCIVTLSKDKYTYDGEEKKPTVTVKDGTKMLVDGTDYTITYSGNMNVGTATVTIIGQGNYSGTKTTEFIIEKNSETVKPTVEPTVKPTVEPTVKPTVALKKVKLSKVSSPTKKKIKATWKKVSSASGYQVQLATNKKFTTGKKSAVIKKKGTVTKTFTGLKKGRTYYVRVRMYKTVNGKKQYGAWSAVKSKKCK